VPLQSMSFTKEGKTTMRVLGCICVWIGAGVVIFETNLLPFIGFCAILGAGFWATAKILTEENPKNSGSNEARES